MVRGTAVARQKPRVEMPDRDLLELCESVWDRLELERRRLVQRVREAVRRGEYQPRSQDVGAAIAEWLTGARPDQTQPGE